MVEIVRTRSGKREKPEFGAMRDEIIDIDPDWWKPLTDEEVEAFLEGRY